jgi:hypothetical protein
MEIDDNVVATLATKADLELLATKTDLESFLTADLDRRVTRLEARRLRR